MAMARAVDFCSALVVVVCLDCLDIEEAALLAAAAQEQFFGPRIPRFVPGFRFDPFAWTAFQCHCLLRFEQEDLERLRRAFRIPDLIATVNGTVASGLEALCLVLYRLCYPCRWVAVQIAFPRSVTHLSQCFNLTVAFLHRTWIHLLAWPQQYRTQAFLQVCAAQATAAGCLLPGCVGFMDGTLVSIATPQYGQAAAYSGHKKEHGIKFQNVTVPNGIVVHQYGPVEGRRTDAFVYGISQLPALLQDMLAPTGLLLYADGGYALTNFVIVP